MAFSPKKIYLSDLYPNIGIGVNLPFSGPSVFESNYQTQDAIKMNLINYFLTNPGEIPLNPTFGGGLRKYIFDQITNNTLDGLKEHVSQKINTYFPNIVIDSLVILSTTQENAIKIILKYNIPHTDIINKLEIQL